MNTRALDGYRCWPWALAFSMASWGGSVNAAQLRSGHALKTEIKESRFQATLQDGYHFNEKAPNGLILGRVHQAPTSLSPRQVTIENLPQDRGQARINLYVCDDQKTFCEIHTVPLASPGAAKTLGAGNFARQTKATPNKKNREGFFLDFPSALKMAQSSRKLMLVDFGARWCPACVRLEAEVFKAKEFKAVTGDLVKVKVDVDEFHNAPLLEKYAVRFFPTLLVLTSDGEEILRFVDYQPLTTITRGISEAQGTPLAIATLEKQTRNPELEKLLASRYFHGGQLEKALTIFEKVEPKPIEYWTARVEHARATLKSRDKAAYLATLRAALKNEPKSTRSLYWRTLLIPELPKGDAEATKLAQEAKMIAAELLKDSQALKVALATDSPGEYTGYEGIYVASMAAEAQELAGLQAREAWASVVEQGERYQVTPETPGISLRVLSALSRSERFGDALKFVQGLRRRDPKNGELQRRELRILLRLERFKDAVRVGEMALKNSYGENEFLVVEPLAKAYMGLNDKARAKSLVQKYLRRDEIHLSDLKDHKESLEKIEAEL